VGEGKIQLALLHSLHSSLYIFVSLSFSHALELGAAGDMLLLNLSFPPSIRPRLQISL
jgi:hypothetical protein